MTYTHLTTNELVIIEAYYQENRKVSDIAKSLGRSKQTIQSMNTMTSTKRIKSAVAVDKHNYQSLRKSSLMII